MTYLQITQLRDYIKKLATKDAVSDNEDITS